VTLNFETIDTPGPRRASSFPLPSSSPTTVVRSFTTPGITTDVVPAGATTATIECYGAQGGRGTTITGGTPGGDPGKGGYTKATIAVTPGETLDILVGGQGGSAGTVPSGSGGGTSTDSANGTGGSSTGSVSRGGAGGGRSEVSRAGTPLIIAGAGGGGGGGSPTHYSGQAGKGGDGGGLIGQDGGLATAGAVPSDLGGGGGTQAAGGSSHNGTPGSSLQGGDAQTLSVSGGGGGDGYFGGGGGDSDAPAYNAPGGGGGSSYATGSSITHTQGVRSGDGLVVITYNATAASDVADALFDGPATGQEWHVSRATITNTSTSDTAATLYLDTSNPSSQRGQSDFGNSDVLTFNPPLIIPANRQLLCEWTGGSPGSVGTIEIDYTVARTVPTPRRFLRSN